MIKRIRFATRRHDVSPDALAAGWRATAEAAAAAPAHLRPVRISVSTVLPALTGTAALYDAVGFAWFNDDEHLKRYSDWLDTAEGHAAESLIERLTDSTNSRILVAEEKVVRGQDWFTGHRQEGDSAFQHLAIAIRANGMTPAEFSSAWSGHAGTIRGAAADRTTQPVAIPAEVRGTPTCRTTRC